MGRGRERAIDGRDREMEWKLISENHTTYLQS